MLLNIPVELQEKIISYCGNKDLKNLICCCTAYRDVLNRYLWKSLSLSNIQLLKNDFSDVKKLQLLPYTKEVCFSEDDLSLGAGRRMEMRKVCLNCKIILQHGSIKVLHLRYIPKDIFSVIVKLRNLVELRIECEYLIDSLQYEYLNDANLQTICKRLIGLKALIISVAGFDLLITNEGLCHLDEFLGLEILVLRNVNIKYGYFTDIGLSYMTSLNSLKRLSLVPCTITDVGASYISQLVMLKELCLDCSEINDSEISIISSLFKLEKLSIAFSDITDVGLEYISKLLILKELDIDGCESITDVGISHLCTLNKLRKFNLKYCNKVTGKHLGNFLLLEELCIADTNIRNEDLSNISNLTFMKILDISDNYIFDAGVSYLTKLVSLRMLNLQLTGVTEFGISMLKSLPRLKKVLWGESWDSIVPYGSWKY